MVPDMYPVGAQITAAAASTTTSAQPPTTPVDTPRERVRRKFMTGRLFEFSAARVMNSDFPSSTPFESSAGSCQSSSLFPPRRKKAFHRSVLEEIL